ncbi:MAG: hypothetical protein JST39_10875, partial [Bacteroidetes bacterium]|nr:hypothetical protein [Bacteroidota bacterium]
MTNLFQRCCLSLAVLGCAMGVQAQKKEMVKIVKTGNNKLDVLVGGRPFTSFLFPDTLEKPV